MVETREELLLCIEDLEEIRTQAFLSCLYLTGGRMNVVLNLNKFDFFDSLHNDIVLFWINNIPIRYDVDGEFIWYVKEYIKHLLPEERLFRFKRITGWLILNDNYINCFGLRKLRHNDLLNSLGVSLVQYKTFSEIAEKLFLDKEPKKDFQELHTR